MATRFQVTFDAHDPRALSSFWRDVLGYVHPGPPGVDLPEDADAPTHGLTEQPGRRWKPDIYDELTLQGFVIKRLQ